MNLFNYPVVVYPAPKREYGGHSAFVTNVRWLHRLEMDLALATVGGRDATMILWRVIYDPSEDTEPMSLEEALPYK